MKRSHPRRPITLSDALIKLHQESRLIYQATRIQKRHFWLSGTPYLWSGFMERAFVFADPAQAKALIKRFPEHFTGAEIRSEAILAVGMK